MKHLRLSIIATATALALTACSSGGGGGNSNSATATPKTESKVKSLNTQDTGSAQNSNVSASSSTQNNVTVPAANTTKPAETTPTVNVTKPAETTPTVNIIKSAETTPTVNITKPAETTPTTDNTISNVFVGTGFTTMPDKKLSGITARISPTGKVSAAATLNYAQEDLNELVIDDKKIAIFTAKELLNGGDYKVFTQRDVREGSTSGKVSGYAMGNGDTFQGAVGGFQDMHFGVFNEGENSTLFVQGYITPVSGVGISRNSDQVYPMPKSGKVTYTQAFSAYGEKGKYQLMDTTIQADFGEKTVNVTLKDPTTTQTKVAFDATIDGNTFAGNTNGVESKGAFYGSVASQIGGVFYQTTGEDKGKNGVFGGAEKRFTK
ncbi:transferrin-binding protein-like solute binding protein [Lonepinella sp. BR2357]|uniref:transferrin-binding protein-like solute binding protein n=1 Tax=Lonepinella sp. BR2357 TaxID=3434549 RepID=UPI003F6DABE6